MAAALVDQNELSSLRIEQSQLIALLKNKVDSWRVKLVRLAEILERRYELADPEFQDQENFSVSRISTIITHTLRAHNIAIADHVSDYLPSKYKNENLARDYLDKNGPTSWGGIDPSLLIEELIAIPRETIESLSTEKKQILYDVITKSNGLKNILEADALNKGYQFHDKKLRAPIRTPRPFEPHATKYTEEVRRHATILNLWADTVDQRCPPPPELEEEFAKGERAATEIYENFINEKYSLSLGEWLERDLYRVHQSKHGAAVKDRVHTLLCNKCSVLTREEYQNGDFVQAKWNWNSPTHWECPSCHEMEDFVLRPLTREQCGDKGHERCPQCGFKFNWDIGVSPMDALAIDLVNNLPGYYNSLQYYNTFMQKCIATRKVELGVDLSSKS